MKNIDANGHVRGESLFIDDIGNENMTKESAEICVDLAKKHQQYKFLGNKFVRQLIR